MKKIAGDEDNIRLCDQERINRTTEGVGNVGLPLIDSGGGVPVVLAEPEMHVGEMGELHD